MIDDSIISFFFSRSSALTHFLRGIATQRTYFGEPIETPQDWALYGLSQVTPIWMQTFLIDEPRGDWKAMVGEILGLRTNNQSAYYRFNKVAENYIEHIDPEQLSPSSKLKYDKGEKPLSSFQVHSHTRFFREEGGTDRPPLPPDTA